MQEKILQQASRLMDGAVQVLPHDELLKKLSKERPLRIKLGMDPTAPDLHLGHAVVLEKLKDFQNEGHEVICLIGDFTALIGDPSGRSKTRPVLNADQIAKNAQTYFQQVGRILDLSKTQIVYNSSWLGALNFSDVIKIAGKVTLARIIERDDFQKRLESGEPIGFHELLYPIMQGYDSVALAADVELGGTDQTFNLLMGRHLQEHYEQDAQVIMTMPLLEGLDGVQKMSKSLGNYIGLFEDPSQAFGKLMSISDELMWRYYSILLRRTDSEVEAMRQAVALSKSHPMDLKKEMAQEIIAKYWSDEQAHAARVAFENVFQRHSYEDIPVVHLSHDCPESLWIVDLMIRLGAVSTSSEAKRLIEANAVSIDEIKVTEFKAQIMWHEGMIVKVGKHRMYKVAR